jgi:hypothetical protein
VSRVPVYTQKFNCLSIFLDRCLRCAIKICSLNHLNRQIQAVQFGTGVFGSELLIGSGSLGVSNSLHSGFVNPDGHSGRVGLGFVRYRDTLFVGDPLCVCQLRRTYWFCSRISHYFSINAFDFPGGVLFEERAADRSRFGVTRWRLDALRPTRNGALWQGFRSIDDRKNRCGATSTHE